ncbi:MAG: leucine-rich repeat domain-containing protein [Planctomycetaceae bacterium]
MSGTLYEFAAAEPRRPRKKWLTGVLLCPAVAAAAWGLFVLERKRADALVQESFRLEVDVENRVFVAMAEAAELSEECVSSLVNYPRLQMVGLSGTIKVGGGLRSLVDLEDLRVLDLRDCAWVDDEQAAWFGEMTNLKRLDLSGTRITDAALRTLRDLPNLSFLGLEGCRGVTDAGLQVCADMRRLRVLRPGGAGYSTDGLLSLRDRRRDLFLLVQRPDVRGRDSERSSSSAEISATCSSATGLITSFRGGLARDGDVDDMDANWTGVGLHGGAAGPCLEKLFPLAPQLAELSLEKTTVAGEDFPFHLIPEGLRSLEIKNSAVSESFLRRLSQHAALERLSLSAVTIDGIAIADADLYETEDWESVNPVNAAAFGVKMPTVTSLSLRGPAAGRLLPTFLRFAPDVVILHLNGITIDAEDFPFDQLPSGLRRVDIAHAHVSESFLRRLSQRPALKRLSLYEADIDGVENASAVLDHSYTFAPIHPVDVTVYDAEVQTATSLTLRGPAAGRLLATFLPLAPKLVNLDLQETTIDTEDIPFDLLPPGLRRLDIFSAQTSESFWRVLSKHTALEWLELNKVSIDGVDLTDPAWGRLMTLRLFMLHDVTVNGVDLTNPAMEPLRTRLSEQLPDARVYTY